MKSRCFQLSLLVVFALCCTNAIAGARVGSVTSSGPLVLNGTPISARAVATLPLMSGDQIATTTSPVVILLQDSSRVFVAANSRVRVSRDGAETSVRLMAGT